MARNMYPGTCYQCGKWVPTGFGHFERHKGHWRVKCVKCASGRNVSLTDYEVQATMRERDRRAENADRHC
jgi:hypothetical protein